MEPLERAEHQAKEMGRFLKTMLPAGWGFILILANYTDRDDARRMTYIASVDRGSVPTLLREMADKLEKEEGEV